MTTNGNLMTIFISPQALSISNENITTQINNIILLTNHKPQDTLTTHTLQTKLIHLSVEQHKTITGVIITDKLQGDIETLCVHPDHQNKGIGKLLLTRTLNPYSPVNYPFQSFKILAPKDNFRVITLFKKNNFIEQTHNTDTHIKLTYLCENKP